MRKLIFILIFFLSTNSLAIEWRYICEESHKVMIQENPDGTTYHGKASDLNTFIFEKKNYDNYSSISIKGKPFDNYIDSDLSCEEIGLNFVCKSDNGTTSFLISNGNFSYSMNFPKYSNNPTIATGNISSIGKCNEF